MNATGTDVSELARDLREAGERRDDLEAQVEERGEDRLERLADAYRGAERLLERYEERATDYDDFAGFVEFQDAFVEFVENLDSDLPERAAFEAADETFQKSRLTEEDFEAAREALSPAREAATLLDRYREARETFGEVFDADPVEDLGMELLYDVAHNIAKKEVHEVGVDPEGRPVGGGEAADREERELYVHRKGATRAFPAGRPEVPKAYRDTGQPVIIPGSMGAGSYVLRGGEQSMDLTFGSTAHGAGRVMSRTQAKQEFWGGDVQDDLQETQQIYVKAQSGATVAEEAPGVYKDVDEVVRVSDALGIGDKVARTFPVVNIKG